MFKKFKKKFSFKKNRFKKGYKKRGKKLPSYGSSRGGVRL